MKTITPTRSPAALSRGSIVIALVLAGMGLGPLSLSVADSVKIAKFWVPDVTVERIADGNLIFTTKSGEEVEKALTAVEGIKLDAFPDLAKAYAAIEAKKPAEAVPFLQKVAAAAPKPWIKQFCKAQLIWVFDQAKMPIESANMLLELSRESSEKAFFENPTDKSLASLDVKAKRDLHERLVQAQATLKGPPADAVKAMLESLGPIEAAVAPGTPATPATPATPGTAVTPGTPAVAAAAGPSAIPLPTDMEAKDPVAIMLRKGDFAGALKATDEILAKPTQEMSLRLYQNGLAKLYLSLANKSEAEAKAQLMDAGLTFARCYYYFPRSTWSGPVGIELGFFNQKTGHPEIAKALYSKASIKIDSDRDPALRARLDELIGEANSTSSE